MDDLSREFLEKHFGEKEPSVLLRVAFEHGYGPSLIPLLERVFLDPEFSLPREVTEAVQVLAHSACQNKYCAVFHATALMSTGFSLEEVQALVERQILPERVEGRERWEPTLRRIVTLFHTPDVAQPLYSQLVRRHKGRERDDLGALLAFCSLDRFVLEFHSGEIDVKLEPIVFEMSPSAPDLIAYFTSEKDKKLPTVALCCMCKDVQTTDGWMPIEQALVHIPGESRFSHGYCPTCTERELAALDAKYA